MKSSLQSFLSALAILALGILIGRLLLPAHQSAHSLDHHATKTPRAAEFTCSMHPQIRQSAPGQCPICGMDLIPVGQSNHEQEGHREISLSPHAAALARITTTPVERRFPDVEIRLFGKVGMDETRLRSITARFPARMERLYLNYTGARVNAGEHLAQIFSPDLLTAQAELLAARRFGDPRTLRSARDKLLLWGLGEAAITAIETRGEPTDRMDIEAPLTGFVVEKMVNEGDYVQTGSTLFKMADLTAVWVLLDAYEMDKPWLRYGQPVTFTAAALPGRSFEGRISFIPPALDNNTRTFKIRVNADNKNLLLRPGMFVTAVVKARIASDGVALDPGLEGKWISPMHPEIVKDAPGQCDVCGMDLVPAAELGYASAQQADPPLLVPASAVLQTGRRAVVYVETPGRDRPTYEGREVVLGARAGGDYIVRTGLQEGERVVTHGAFKLDSALQIQAKPSMMSTTNQDGESPIEASPEIAATLGQLTKAYFSLWRSLAADDLHATRSAATTLENQAHSLPSHHGNNEASRFLEETLAQVIAHASAVAKAENLQTARFDFEHLSNTLIRAIKTIGLPEQFEVHHAYCPMAFDGRRADWLQDNTNLLNPYFGAAMLTCGNFDQLLTPRHKPPPSPPHSQTGHNHSLQGF